MYDKSKSIVDVRDRNQYEYMDRVFIGLVTYTEKENLVKYLDSYNRSREEQEEEVLKFFETITSGEKHFNEFLDVTDTDPVFLIKKLFKSDFFENRDNRAKLESYLDKIKGMNVYNTSSTSHGLANTIVTINTLSNIEGKNGITEANLLTKNFLRLADLTNYYMACNLDKNTLESLYEVIVDSESFLKDLKEKDEYVKNSFSKAGNLHYGYLSEKMENYFRVKFNLLGLNYALIDNLIGECLYSKTTFSDLKKGIENAIYNDYPLILNKSHTYNGLMKSIITAMGEITSKNISKINDRLKKFADCVRYDTSSKEESDFNNKVKDKKPWLGMPGIGTLISNIMDNRDTFDKGLKSFERDIKSGELSSNLGVYSLGYTALNNINKRIPAYNLMPVPVKFIEDKNEFPKAYKDVMVKHIPFFINYVGKGDHIDIETNRLFQDTLDKLSIEKKENIEKLINTIKDLLMTSYNSYIQKDIRAKNNVINYIERDKFLPDSEYDLVLQRNKIKSDNNVMGEILPVIDKFIDIINQYKTGNMNFENAESLTAEIITNSYFLTDNYDSKVVKIDILGEGSKVIHNGKYTRVTSLIENFFEKTPPMFYLENTFRADNPRSIILNNQYLNMMIDNEKDVERFSKLIEKIMQRNGMLYTNLYDKDYNHPKFKEIILEYSQFIKKLLKDYNDNKDKSDEFFYNLERRVENEPIRLFTFNSIQEKVTINSAVLGMTHSNNINSLAGELQKAKDSLEEQKDKFLAFYGDKSNDFLDYKAISKGISDLEIAIKGINRNNEMTIKHIADPFER